MMIIVVNVLPFLITNTKKIHQLRDRFVPMNASTQLVHTFASVQKIITCKAIRGLASGIFADIWATLIRIRQNVHTIVSMMLVDINACVRVEWS